MGFNFREAANFYMRHTETQTGGTKFPKQHTLEAHDDETHQQGGVAEYFPPKRKGGPVHVDSVQGFAPGAGSALMKEIEERHPGSPVKFMNEVKRGKNTPSSTNGAHGEPTDWETWHPQLPGTVHRGFSLRMDKSSAKVINASGSTKEDHLKALHEALPEGPNVGVHWSADENSARTFSHRAIMDHRTDIPVMLHARTPQRKDIETRPDQLLRNGVFPVDHPGGEQEVPMRRGRKLEVTGISWKPDVDHPDADHNGWMHHAYGEGESKRHTAAMNEEEDDGGSVGGRDRDMDQATGPEAPEGLAGNETPTSCSYCGSTEFTNLTDNGRVRQATCAACDGTMSAHPGTQWTPELIGDPSNHPKPNPDPRSGGVGGAGAAANDPLVRDNSRLGANKGKLEDSWNRHDDNGGPDGISNDEYEHLSAYSADGVNEDLNRHLRGQPLEYMDANDKDDQETLHSVQHSMENLAKRYSPKQDMHVWRTAPVGKLHEGQEIHDPAFMSTTEHRHVAEGYTDPGHTLMKIHVPAGSRAIPMHHLTRYIGAPGEVVLPPGSKLHVRKVHEDHAEADLVQNSTNKTAAVDWCAHRRTGRCWYPGDKTIVAMPIPQDRGPCPWTTPWQQQVCPISEPGPMALMQAKGSKALSWDEIGDRHPHIYGDSEIHGEAADGADGPGIGDAANYLAHERSEDPDAENNSVHDLDFHEETVHPRHIDYSPSGVNDDRVTRAREGYQRHPEEMPPLVLVHRHGVYQVADGHHRAEAAHGLDVPVKAYVAHSPYPDEPFRDGDKAPFYRAESTHAKTAMPSRNHPEHPEGVTYLSVPVAYEMAKVARQDPEFAFHVTAAWSDVRSKAKRIRSEGKVQIKIATAEGLAGEVQGDHGSYENMITYRPGSRKIADWHCACKWGDWAWDRIRFHGRQCSHSLALQYEAQSRGMFGKEIKLGALTFGETHAPDEIPGFSAYPIVTIAASLVDQDEDPANIMKLLMAYGLTHSSANSMLQNTLLFAKESSIQVEADGEKMCQQCGHMLQEDAKRCPVCNAEVEDDFKDNFHDAALHVAESEEDERRKKHHRTMDTRRHAPNFGYGIPGWIGLPIGTCGQCSGWGCGHCGGTGQVAQDGNGNTADAVSDQNGDEGPMMSGGISDTSSLHTAKETQGGPTCSGVALKAADTGRVLMLQRCHDEKDAAGGKWEFPGGHHEDGDTTSLHAGIREWEEEVGQPFPEGGVVHHTWTSPSGIYQGHVVVIPSEKHVSMKDGRVIPNPDDPKGDGHEQAAWWDINHAKGNKVLRDEVKAHTPWNEIAKAGEQKTASAWDPLSGEGETPGFPYAAPLHSNSQNPASTGWATAEDPKSWANATEIPDHLIPSGSYDGGSYYGMLHDEPEPALPSTDGADSDGLGWIPPGSEVPETHSSIADTDGSLTPNQFTGSVNDIVTQFQATAGARAIEKGGLKDNSSQEIAEAAQAHLKTALKDFNFHEQQELINEGKTEGSRARNFANLQIEGTHYESLAKALGIDEENAEELFS